MRKQSWEQKQYNKSYKRISGDLRKREVLKIVRKVAVRYFEITNLDEKTLYDIDNVAWFYDRLCDASNNHKIIITITPDDAWTYYDIYVQFSKKLLKKKERAEFLNKNYQPLESDLFTF